MTATYTKVLLSESADGAAILISATGSAGTLIHTADASALDEIWIYVVNTGASSAKLTLQWGETTEPDGNIEQDIAPENGLYLVAPGLLLTNSLALRGYSDLAGVLAIHGFVNRIS